MARVRYVVSCPTCKTNIEMVSNSMATPQGKHRQFYYQASENENDQVYDDDDILRTSPNKSLV